MRLSTKFWVTLARLRICSQVWFRLPATNRWISPRATDRSDSAASRSDLLSFTTLVKLASRFSNMTICSLLSRSAVTKVCRFLMMSTMLPLPSAKILAAPDNWASVCRSLSPLPSSAFAALSITLDRDRGSVHGYDRAVTHGGSAALAVGRRELNVTRRHQVLGDDHRLGVSRNGHAVIDLQGQLRSRAIGFDGVDLADLDTRHTHLVAGVDCRGGREVRGDGVGPEEDLAHQHHDSGDECDGQDYRSDHREGLTGCHHWAGLLVAGCR